MVWGRWVGGFPCQSAKLWIVLGNTFRQPDFWGHSPRGGAPGVLKRRLKGRMVWLRTVQLAPPPPAPLLPVSPAELAPALPVLAATSAPRRRAARTPVGRPPPGPRCGGRRGRRLGWTTGQAPAGQRPIPKFLACLNVHVQVDTMPGKAEFHDWLWMRSTPQRFSTLHFPPSQWHVFHALETSNRKSQL